ncbi:MAG TPA: hypothetical protein VFJ14_10260 [Nocardioidaceae bacterium]|nr:hypothetical protein [Nocardioidaceae bacterium]
MTTTTAKSDLVAAVIAAGDTRAESTLRRKSVADLEALLADLTCGGCDNGEHCGSCACCPAEDAAEDAVIADLPAEQPAEPVEETSRTLTGIFAQALATTFAEDLAAGFGGVAVRKENRGQRAREVFVSGEQRDAFADLLEETVAAAMGAMRDHQRATAEDRKALDIQAKFVTDRAFLLGYGQAAGAALAGKTIRNAKDDDAATVAGRAAAKAAATAEAQA